MIDRDHSDLPGKAMAFAILAGLLLVIGLIFYAGYEALQSMQPPDLKRHCECPGHPTLEKFE